MWKVGKKSLKMSDQAEPYKPITQSLKVGQTLCASGCGTTESVHHHL